MKVTVLKFVEVYQDQKDDYLKKAEITINRKTASEENDANLNENQAENMDNFNNKNAGYLNNKDNGNISSTNDASKTLKSKGKDGKDLMITEPLKDGTVENDTKNNENEEDNENKSNRDSCIHL